MEPWNRLLPLHLLRTKDRKIELLLLEGLAPSLVKKNGSFVLYSSRQGNEDVHILKKDIVEKLWSVKEKLTKKEELTTSELNAINLLLTDVSGIRIPTKQEVLLYEEALTLILQTTSESAGAYFEARIEAFEKKYPDFDD